MIDSTLLLPLRSGQRGMGSWMDFPPSPSNLGLGQFSVRSPTPRYFNEICSFIGCSGIRELIEVDAHDQSDDLHGPFKPHEPRRRIDYNPSVIMASY